MNIPSFKEIDKIIDIKKKEYKSTNQIGYCFITDGAVSMINDYILRHKIVGYIYRDDIGVKRSKYYITLKRFDSEDPKTLSNMIKHDKRTLDINIYILPKSTIAVDRITNAQVLKLTSEVNINPIIGLCSNGVFIPINSEELVWMDKVIKELRNGMYS